MNLQL